MASISCLCGGLLYEARCFDELPVWYEAKCPDCGKRNARVMDPCAKPTPDFHDGMSDSGYGFADVVDVSRAVRSQYDNEGRLISPSAQEAR